MKTYTISASIALTGWVEVESETPKEALEEAKKLPVSMWEWDTADAEISYPYVEDPFDEVTE